MSTVALKTSIPEAAPLPAGQTPPLSGATGAAPHSSEASMGGKKTGDVILDVKNISLRFGGVKALTDISFNVKEHEIRSIIGPNGAGKSSMLNCINGVYTPWRAPSPFAARPSRT